MVTFNSLESKNAEKAFEMMRTAVVVPNVPDVATCSMEAEEVFVTMRTDGVVQNVTDVVTFKSLETLEKIQELFETMREASMVPKGPLGEAIAVSSGCCT
jgi:hypothetical protein